MTQLENMQNMKNMAKTRSYRKGIHALVSFRDGINKAFMGKAKRRTKQRKRIARMKAYHDGSSHYPPTYPQTMNSVPLPFYSQRINSPSPYPPTHKQ